MITLSTKSFHWDKNRNVLFGEVGEKGIEFFKVSSDICVVSEHTGKKIVFKYDEVAAIQNEFWDGEFAEYIPTTECKVRKLVLKL